MDVDAEIIRGLTSNPKFIPYWYTYDIKGEKLYLDWSRNNKHYYFWRDEKSLLQGHIGELVNMIPKPFLLADLGCGDGKKSRYIIEEYFKKKTPMTVVPIDVCKDILQDVKDDMTKLYGNKLDVDPISGMFKTSVPKLFSNHVDKRKLLACFGGTIQNLSYNEQIKLLSLISDGMHPRDDFLMISIDITQDKALIENAYLDPDGYGQKFYDRNLLRLMEDYDADFRLENFKLEGEFIPNVDNNIPGAQCVWFRSLCDQTVNIEKLRLSIKIRKDEKISLSESGCRSYKYNEKQLNIMFRKSDLQAVKMWKNQHCAIVLLKKTT